MAESDAAAEPARPLKMLDRALEATAPMVDRHIERIRKNCPDATPARVVKRLNGEFRAATVSAGTGVGAAAAAPGVGTAAALGISGLEAISFMQASALYVLARAHVQGLPIGDVERRRTLVMAVMLGDAATRGLPRVAERTGQHWGKYLVEQVPRGQLQQINKVLGRNFVTLYGRRQSFIVLGCVAPFGIGAAIGAAANGATSQGVISAANKAFGKPPVSWSDEPTAKGESA